MQVHDKPASVIPAHDHTAAIIPAAGRHRGVRRKIPWFFLEVIMIAFTLVYFYPVFLLLITSLKTTREVIFTPMALPKTFYLGNFVKAWNNLNLSASLLNSLFISTIAVVCIIVFASMASFTIAKKKSKFHDGLYVFFLAGIMVPIYTVLVPVVQLVKNLGLMNSRIGLIIIYIGINMPFAVFLMTGFIRGIPSEIVEAGIIDGCPVFKIFWALIFPLLTPIVATLFILDFLGVWNDFLLPMLTLSDPSLHTVTLSMYSFFGEFGSQWEVAFAGYALAILPIVTLYLFLQRYIIKGIMSGAVKG